jgi:hypothetical protein
VREREEAKGEEGGDLGWRGRMGGALRP